MFFYCDLPVINSTVFHSLRQQRAGFVPPGGSNSILNLLLGHLRNGGCLICPQPGVYQLVG